MGSMENSAVKRDLAQIKAPVAPDAELIAKAAKETGLNPFKVGWDYRKLKKGVGRLRFDEYYMYGLHDPSKWAEGERERFLSAYIHWNIFDEISTRNWWAVTEDKWVSGTLLEAAGLPVPETVGVISTAPRVFPGTQKLTSAQEVQKFVSGSKDLPLFAKLSNSMWSAGSFVISGGDKTHIHIHGEEPMSYDRFMSEFVGEAGYVLQKTVQPHKFFDGITTATPTIRVINLINASGIMNPFAVLKLPMGDNIADNFWRSGNLVCALDLNTGAVQSIVSKDDGKLTRHDSLPGSDRTLIGETVPFWTEARALNETVAMMHADIPFGSTDIAITDSGPLVIEVNCGSAFELPQIATGKGFLTDEVQSFFRGLGSKIVG